MLFGAKEWGGVAAVLSAAMVMGSTLTVDASTIKDVFDASYYSKTYSDLAKAFADNADALYNHYLTYGQKEGRVVVPYIDLKKYKEAYADLRAAFGDNWDAYLQHYLTFGVKEGRKSFGKAFDARAYADRYPDVKKAFGYDVLALYQHYLQFGKNEGRNPLPDAPKAVVASSNPSTPAPSPKPDDTDKPNKPDKPGTDQPTYPVAVKALASGKLVDEKGNAITDAEITFTKKAEVGVMQRAGISTISGGDVSGDDTSGNNPGQPGDNEPGGNEPGGDVTGGDVTGNDPEEPKDPEEFVGGVGASVTITPEKDGTVKIILPVGVYEVKVTATGYQEEVFEVSVAYGQESVTLKLPVLKKAE